jgi:hypothetical protein
LISCSYQWSYDDLTVPNITGLGPGTYRVFVRDSSPACSVALAIFNITSPDALSVYFNYTAPTTTGGVDGTATAHVSGGYVFAALYVTFFLYTN